MKRMSRPSGGMTGDHFGLTSELDKCLRLNLTQASDMNYDLTELKDFGWLVRKVTSVLLNNCNFIFSATFIYALLDMVILFLLICIS